MLPATASAATADEEAHGHDEHGHGDHVEIGHNPPAGVAKNDYEPVEHGGDHDRGVGRFAVARAVGERARRPVEIPRARLAERLADVLHEEPVSLGQR